MVLFLFFFLGGGGATIFRGLNPPKPMPGYVRDYSISKEVHYGVNLLKSITFRDIHARIHPNNMLIVVRNSSRIYSASVGESITSFGTKQFGSSC